MKPRVLQPCLQAALAVALYAGMGLAWAQGTDSAPSWEDEPPTLSRWIEEGYKAELSRQPWRAAQRYCAAARYGSLQAQNRLGRLRLRGRGRTPTPAGGLLLLGRGLTPDPATGTTLLALAAQRGHEKARLLLAGKLPGDRLPDCLTQGDAPAQEFLEASQEAVPHEVVASYVSSLPREKRRMAELVQRLAPRFSIDPRLALAIVRSESNFEAQALSPRNAQGLMQLIPETAERFGVRDAWNPEQNVRGGLAYLRWLLAYVQGDVRHALAAYNTGEGAVERHAGIPPYGETQADVRRVGMLYPSDRHPFDAAVTEASRLVRTASRD